MRAVLVAIAGAAGALSRYGIGVAVGALSFPWATLGINVVGSFALGVVLAVGPDRWNADVVTALAIGFLGAFTTFSTFSYEVQQLLRDDRTTSAITYVALSVIAGIAAAAAGWTVGRDLASGQ